METRSLRVLSAVNTGAILGGLLHHFWGLLLLLDIWWRGVASILSRCPCISHVIWHGGLLAAIKGLNAVSLIRQLIWSHLSSMLPAMLGLPLLQELLLVLLQITFKLIYLRSIIHVGCAILLDLFLNLRCLLNMLLVFARNNTFPRIHAICGLEWTMHTSLRIRVVHHIQVHWRVLGLHNVFQAWWPLMDWIKIAVGIVEWCLGADLLLLL